MPPFRNVLSIVVYSTLCLSPLLVSYGFGGDGFFHPFGRKVHLVYGTSGASLYALTAHGTWYGLCKLGGLLW